MIALIKASQFLLGISILVVIHELGHFLAARAFGIKVEKFFLFFDAWGFKLFKYKRGDTEYGIGWLPLGGYVKISGMIDESMDKDFAKSEPQPWEFRSKPGWQRLIVMLGGIIMNLILGVLIFWLHSYTYGEEYLPASILKNGIEVHQLGKQAGFKTGDVILRINGKEITKANEISGPDLFLKDNIKYDITRDGQPMTITLPQGFSSSIANSGPDSFINYRVKFAVEKLTPENYDGAEKAGVKAGDSIIAVSDTATPYFGLFAETLNRKKKKDITLSVKRAGSPEIVKLKAKVSDDGKIGFKPAMVFAVEKYSLGEAFVHGNERAWGTISNYIKSLKRLITGALPAKKSLQGFIGIANAYGGTWNWESFWALTGILSMILAVMNFLPIPALDGGHVLFLLVEMVRRKPLSYRFLEIAQIVGISILLLLTLFALYNDIVRYVFKL